MSVYDTEAYLALNKRFRVLDSRKFNFLNVPPGCKLKEKMSFYQIFLLIFEDMSWR